MNALSIESRMEIIGQIDSFLQSKELSNLTDKELEYISKSLLADKLKEDLKTEIKKYHLDIAELKTKWLSRFNSDATKRSYSYNLNIFLSWLTTRDTRNSVVSLKAVDVDDYVAYLKNQGMSDSTMRLRIATVSSFLSYLQRIDIVDKNYFKGIQGLPKKRIDIKTYDEIPQDEDIQVIENELRAELIGTSGKGYIGKRHSARIGIVVLSIIKHHGLRVGALNTLIIDRKGYFKAYSKEDIVRGKLNQEVVELIDKMGFDRKAPFKDFKTQSIKMWFVRFCKRLVRDGKLKEVYSLHDLRHYSAIRHWNEHKDIYRLKKFLNHKSISTTQIYLSSLNVEN